MPTSIFRDLLLLLGLATGISFLMRRLRQSTVVGYLLTGLLAGPYGLRLISDTDVVEHLAELGVALLLFTVGLEVSLERLAKMKQIAFVGGGLQVGLTVLLTMGVMSLAGETSAFALFWGFLVSVSSTAIVMKLLEERSEIETVPGRISLGILLFQDLCVVPMMALVPILASHSLSGQLLNVAWALGKSLLIVVMIVLSARYLFPRLLRAVVGVRSRELFIMATLLCTLGTAWSAAHLGLSLALGAFIAGVVISESEYAHQAMAAIIPFRDSFSSLFFVAIGMLIDIGYAASHGFIVLGVTTAILLGKVLAGAAAVRLTGFPIRLGVVTAMAVSQVGEFSFVMLREGAFRGMVSEGYYQVFLAAAVLTLAAAPAMVAAGPRVSRWFGRRVVPGEAEDPELEAPLDNHVIVCGYGENGRRLAALLRENNLPYVVIDVNSRAVRHARAAGEKIYFGDLSSTEILRAAGVARAKAVVFAVSDPVILPMAISHARLLNPEVHIIARVKRMASSTEMRQAGATDVIVEEIEAWMEIAVRVLRIFGMPRELLAQQLGELRAADYDMIRILPLPGQPLRHLWHLLPEVDLEMFIVMPGSRLAGMPLRDVDLRRRSGAVVVALVRDASAVYNPGPEVPLAEADQVVLMGSRRQLAEAHQLLSQIQEEGLPAGAPPVAG